MTTDAVNRREELAEKILLQLLANPAQMACCAGGPENVSGWARSIADAFLAACEPEQKPEREPDAVWMLSETSDERGIIAWINGDYPHTEVRKMLAGRDRVRLRVFVEEVEA